MSVVRSGVHPCGIPGSALLNVYANTEEGYADCYATDISADVSLSDFVTAFYTTWIFKLERIILKYAASKPSTDLQAKELGQGLTDHFAAWHVESRTENQLLMCDLSGRTRSWFMIEPRVDDLYGSTRLYFGTAVIPVENKKTGKRSLGFLFNALLGFHKLYSRALLSCAKRRLDMR